MRETRLPCGCYAVPHETERATFVVVSSAFLCSERHHTRDVVTPEDVRRLEGESR